MEGFGNTERFVEIPWCIHRCGNAKVVLDVGYAHAELNYLQGLAGLNIPELYGLDLAAPRYISINLPDGTARQLLKPVQADVRHTPFASDFFDLVLCVSTIEHIGLDNSGYKPGIADPSSQSGDVEAIRELCRVTRPGGRLLLTVPFGKYENHGWFQQYDLDRLMRLATASTFQLYEVNVFRYQNGWTECHLHDLKNTGYQSNGARNAAGLACLELYKPY